MQRSRIFWLLASASLLTGGTLGACSSSSGDTSFGQGDASTDGTVADSAADSGNPRDANGDSFVPPGSCPATTLS
ncbi:MAG: hypothetical protein ABI183_10490, partial [Polyangiaceae bacterium]